MNNSSEWCTICIIVSKYLYVTQCWANILNLKNSGIVSKNSSIGKLYIMKLFAKKKVIFMKIFLVHVAENVVNAVHLCFVDLCTV
jgi:hypothetical protein